MSVKEREQKPHETIDIVLQAIDLYWDNLLEYPQNTLKVTSRDPEEDGSKTTQQISTIQRVYDTAYYLKCEISSLTSWGGNGPIFNNPVETIEYRMLPTLFEKGKLNITHTDATTGIATQADVLIDDLMELDPVAAQTLKNIQLYLLSLLTGHCKDVALFDPLVIRVKELLVEAFGSHDAEELWRAAMFDKDEPQE